MPELLRRLPARLVLALLVLQAGYWLLVHPALIAPVLPTSPVSAEEMTGFDYADLDRPTAAALAAARFAPMPDEQPFFIDRGYHAARATFSIAEVPLEGMGLLWGDSAANRMLFVNGTLFEAKGRMDVTYPTHHGLQRYVRHIPASLLHPGDNRIDAVMVMDYAEQGIIVPPLLAPYGEVSRGFAWYDFLFGPLQLLSLATGMVITLLAGMAWLRSDRQGVLGWFALLSLGWTLATTVIVWVDMPLVPQGKVMVYLASLLVTVLAWPLLVDSWTGEPTRWLRLAALGAGLAGLGAIAWHIGLRFGPGDYEASEAVVRWIGLAALVAMVLRLAWHFARHREERHWEAALLVSMAVVVGSALWKGWQDAIGTVEFTRTQPLFLLLFAVAFFGRNYRLFRSQAQISDLLQGQLDQRTAELEAAHGRETALVRQQAHAEERSRIMRDMHDGLGSNLMSMLLAARRGVAEPQAVAEGLQGVIDEMRLMIDSMDSVGESLATALATFRARMADRAAMAGFRIDWQDSAPRPLPDYPPRAVLQVFRVMQEAVTNALKHSGGDRITVTVGAPPAGVAGLVVTVADNGKGHLGEATSRGRGLANMRSRAASIGAQLDVVEGDHGLTVHLTLPAEAREP